MGTTPERQKILARRWYLANREKTLAATQAWRKANPSKRAEAQRRYRLRKLGLTLEAAHAIFKAQQGRCAICRIKLSWSPGSNSTCLDHCHKTGKVRGYLCNNCNRAIGLLKDSSVVLRAALTYLEN